MNLTPPPHQTKCNLCGTIVSSEAKYSHLHTQAEWDAYQQSNSLQPGFPRWTPDLVPPPMPIPQYPETPDGSPAQRRKL